jgi:anaerobic selenocysteine-containing dehydrogenase
VRQAIGALGDIADAQLGDALFDAIVAARQGTAITHHGYDEIWSLVAHPDRKIRLVVPGMLEWLARLDPASAGAPKEFPFVLAAGQRRMFNANQIFRDPAWRRDDPDGALLINPADLGELGAADGDWVAVESAAGRLVVRCRADGSMRNGQLALPHGYGQSYPAPGGERLTNGPRINLLTESGNRDPIAGTPYHKHIAVRLSRVPADEAAAHETRSQRIHAKAAAE